MRKSHSIVLCAFLFLSLPAVAGPSDAESTHDPVQNVGVTSDARSIAEFAPEDFAPVPSERVSADQAAMVSAVYKWGGSAVVGNQIPMLCKITQEKVDRMVEDGVADDVDRVTRENRLKHAGAKEFSAHLAMLPPNTGNPREMGADAVDCLRKWVENPTDWPAFNKSWESHCLSMKKAANGSTYCMALFANGLGSSEPGDPVGKLLNLRTKDGFLLAKDIELNWKPVYLKKESGEATNAIEAKVGTLIYPDSLIDLKKYYEDSLREGTMSGEERQLLAKGYIAQAQTQIQASQIAYVAKK